MQEIFEMPEHRKHWKKTKNIDSLPILANKSDPIKYTKKRICNDSSEEDDRFPPK